MFFYIEDPCEQREYPCDKRYGDHYTFIEYSDNNDDVYENIENYNQKKIKTTDRFHDIAAEKSHRIVYLGIWGCLS